MTPSLPRDYFTGLYTACEDPWRIFSGWYETRKRALLLAALPRERFRVAFEPGCANGELSVQLAARCDRLIAWDVVDVALERTRARTANLAGVEVRRAALPGQWPEELADLIVLAEVGYYLDRADLEHARDRAAEHLAPGGVLLVVHWRHDAADYPLTGDQVHDIIGAHEPLRPFAGYQDTDFLLDLWTATPAPSVAQQTGLL